MKKLILNLISTIIIIGLFSSCNKDTTPPVITIIEDNPAFACVDSNYEDAGATAIDDEDGDISDKIETTSNVNTSIVGSYYVKYVVTDKEGNRAEATRTVDVDYCK